jgi:hypothetical protein
MDSTSGESVESEGSTALRSVRDSAGRIMNVAEVGQSPTGC